MLKFVRGSPEASVFRFKVLEARTQAGTSLLVMKGGTSKNDLTPTEPDFKSLELTTRLVKLAHPGSVQGIQVVLNHFSSVNRTEQK